MPLVNVLINGHAYTVACDEGEEERLREVSKYLDQRVKELVSSVGQVGDTRLLVMAGLVVCDELSDALGHMEAIEKEVAVLKERMKENDAANEIALAETLEKAAERVEAIAARMVAT
jgi:cell division protein ZapA